MAKLFSTAEAAKFLGVSVITLKRWKKSGKLVPNEIGITSGKRGRKLVSKYTLEQLNGIKNLRRWIKSGKLSRSVAGDNFTGAGDKFALEILKSVSTSKFKHFKGRKESVSVMEEKKSAQVQQRMNKLIVPCDKLSRLPFTLSAENYKKAINGARLEFEEKKATKTKPAVITPYWLEQATECTDMKPLEPFHREVLFACISAYEQGYNYVTFSMTLDALTGGEEKRHIYREQLAAIEAAIKKLRQISITVDLAPLFKGMPKYRKNHVGAAKLTGYLLPCNVLEVELNGQKTIAVELLGESPLMTIAKAKNQFLTYEVVPLQIPNQNNTPRVITIKNWLLRRIKSSKSCRPKDGLSNTIKFDSIYAECGLAELSDSIKRNARKIIFATLDAIKADGIINGYDIKRTGNKFDSITIWN